MAHSGDPYERTNANKSTDDHSDGDTVTIHPDHDFSLVVQEREMDLEPAPGQDRPIKRTITFKVLKSVLKDLPPTRATGNRSATFWQGRLGPRWAHDGDTASKITVTVDSLKSMEIILRVFHKTVDESTFRGTDLSEMWKIADLLDYYNVKPMKLHAWFAEWYEQRCGPGMPISPLAHFQLLWPCWYFDHAAGFLRVSKYAVYVGDGHIADTNPTKLSKWQLPNRVIQQLNAARGRLKIIMFNGIWDPIHPLISESCICSATTIRSYMRCLDGLCVFPFEKHMRRASIEEMMERLANFDLEPLANCCVRCKKDYKAIVKKAISKTAAYFEGLCLDCMDVSRVQRVDNEYIASLTHQMLIEHCRVKHRQPTWYYSYMGLEEDRLRISRHLRDWV